MHITSATHAAVRSLDPSSISWLTTEGPSKGKVNFAGLKHCGQQSPSHFQEHAAKCTRRQMSFSGGATFSISIHLTTFGKFLN
jgi:hypothetical protein